MEKKATKKKDRRVEQSVEGLKEDFAWHLRYTVAKSEENATERDHYTAFANAIRDRIVERWINTQEEYHRQNTKRVYYMSLEFLMGRLLGRGEILQQGRGFFLVIGGNLGNGEPCVDHDVVAGVDICKELGRDFTACARGVNEGHAIFDTYDFCW